MSYIENIDILENLKQENERILNKLIFANNCLKYSIEFILFVDSVFNKVNNYLEDNDILKYNEYVSAYKSMLQGKILKLDIFIILII